MKNVTSLLLMLVMLGVFIQSSQAVICYRCDKCDEITSDTMNCPGDVCFTLTTSSGAFRNTLDIYIWLVYPLYLWPITSVLPRHLFADRLRSLSFSASLCCQR